MSGSGRKSHYRKGVTNDYSHGLPLPDVATNDTVCKVTTSRGTNMFEVEVPVVAVDGLVSSVFQLAMSDEVSQAEAAPVSSSSAAVQQERRSTVTCLARMPSKFKKLIWIKRNDYLIITKDVEKDPSSNSSSSSASATATNSSMEVYDIKHILNPSQIKHIKANNMWPDAFTATTMAADPAAAEVAASAGQSHNPNHKVGHNSSRAVGRKAEGYSADDIMPAYEECGDSGDNSIGGEGGDETGSSREGGREGDR